MNASLTVRDGRPFVSYTFYAGTPEARTLEARIKQSWIPKLLGVGGIALTPHCVRLHRILRMMPVDMLAKFICHEFWHIHQMDKWGWTTFGLMYAPRRIFRGCGRDDKNDIETAGYEFEDATWRDFLPAAQAMRERGLF